MSTPIDLSQLPPEIAEMLRRQIDQSQIPGAAHLTSAAPSDEASTLRGILDALEHADGNAALAALPAPDRAAVVVEKPIDLPNTSIPAAARDAAQRMDLINLDEMVDEYIPVAIHDWRERQIDDPAAPGGRSVALEPVLEDVQKPDPLHPGQMVAARQVAVRVAYILRDPPADLMIEALGALQTYRDMTPQQQMEVSADFVLRQWQITEPDMTKVRLQRGLGLLRITKLFTVFFK